MKRLSLILSIAAVFAASGLFAQKEAAPAPAGFDPEACSKHCREMAESRKKMMDEHKAMAEKNAAAWKEIRASVEAAKKARGEKKVAALQDALDRLVAFHESMMAQMPEGPMGHGMMAHGMHGEMGDGMECCAGHARMPPDCPMMQKKD